jgi:hypothetical protein
LAIIKCNFSIDLFILTFGDKLPLYVILKIKMAKDNAFERY